MMVAMMSISAFGPKYMENQFQIPTWKANIIVGMVFPEHFIAHLNQNEHTR